MRKLLAIPILTLTLLLAPQTTQAHPNPLDHPPAQNALKPLSEPPRATQTPNSTQPPQTAPRPSKRIPSDLTKRCPRWHHKFAEHGLPARIFSYIAWRESRCRPNAINARFNSRGEITWTLNRDGSIDRGLIQVNSTWLTVTSQVCKAPRGQLDVLFDVDCNLAVARYLYNNGGLAHWGM
jgi:hypothetical protein